MPRRPVKHGFQPGVSGNPAGKPPGTTNKIVIAERVREAFSQLLDNNVDKLEEWLIAAAKKDPVKALDLWVRISERFVPMLSRTEITGKDGEAFTPITINLPNIPSISIGEGTPTMIGEGDTLPTEQTSRNLVLGEGTPAFVLPKPQLSENQLRDLREMGMVPPDSLSEGTPAEG